MRVSPIIGRAGGAMKTYPEFQAYIAALATNGSVLWTANGNIAGSYRTQAGPALAGLVMYGSSWLSHHNGSSIGRAIQHGLPSPAVFNEQNSTVKEIFFSQVEGTVAAPYVSQDRNGYNSLAFATPATGFVMTELRYFDLTLGPMWVQPNIGIGPTPFTWP